MFEQLTATVYDNSNKWHLKCLIWSLNLNLRFKPTPFNMLLVALAQTHSYCHVIACIILLHIVMCWLSSFSVAGVCPPSVDDVPTLWSLTLMKTQCYLQKCQASKTPLFISIQSHSLAPALFYCIRTTTIQLLHVAVVEPLSFAWPVIATVNRWNPLAWVGVVWALMCLLIHACCRACYCLELCQVWFIGGELESCEHVLLLRAKCVNTIW